MYVPMSQTSANWAKVLANRQASTQSSFDYNAQMNAVNALNQGMNQTPQSAPQGSPFEATQDQTMAPPNMGAAPITPVQGPQNLPPIGGGQGAPSLSLPTAQQIPLNGYPQLPQSQLNSPDLSRVSPGAFPPPSPPQEQQGPAIQRLDPGSSMPQEQPQVGQNPAQPQNVGMGLQQAIQSLKQAYPSLNGAGMMYMLEKMGPILNRSSQMQLEEMKYQTQMAKLPYEAMNAMSRQQMAQTGVTNAATRADTLELNKKKSDLGYIAEAAQARAAGGYGGKQNPAREDAANIIQGPAASAAMAYLPESQSGLESFAKQALAQFDRDPSYATFAAQNLIAGEAITRAATGGKTNMRTAHEIANRLNAARDRQAWRQIANEGYNTALTAEAKATAGSVKRAGAVNPNADNPSGIGLPGPNPNAIQGSGAFKGFSAVPVEE